MKKFSVIEVSYEDAEVFIQNTHRHLPKCPPKLQIRKCFAIVWKGKTRAVAMLGNPVSPWLSKDYLETRRLASDGLYGACSALYRACLSECDSRNRKLVTYTLQTETGNSLRHSGAYIVHTSEVGRDTRKGRLNITHGIRKVRWEWTNGA